MKKRKSKRVRKNQSSDESDCEIINRNTNKSDVYCEISGDDSPVEDMCSDEDLLVPNQNHFKFIAKRNVLITEENILDYFNNSSIHEFRSLMSMTDLKWKAFIELRPFTNQEEIVSLSIIEIAFILGYYSLGFQLSIKKYAN